MRKSKIFVLIAFTSAVWCGRSSADDLSDISADVEELTADSAAAKSEARANAERAIKEKEETQDEIQKAERTRSAAEASRKESMTALQRAEKEIQRQNAKQAELKAEIKKHETEIAANTKKVQEMNAKLAATQTQTQTLTTLRDEQLAKIAELSKQESEALAATELAQQKFAQAKADFDKSRVDAAAKGERVGKIKDAEAAKQGQLQYQTAQLRKGQLRAPNGMASPAPGATLTFSKDCKVYAKPDATGQALGTKRAGSTLHQARTQKNWVAFPIQGGRTVYVPHGCF